MFSGEWAATQLLLFFVLIYQLSFQLGSRAHSAPSWILQQWSLTGHSTSHLKEASCTWKFYWVHWYWKFQHGMQKSQHHPYSQIHQLLSWGLFIVFWRCGTSWYHSWTQQSQLLDSAPSISPLALNTPRWMSRWWLGPPLMQFCYRRWISSERWPGYWCQRCFWLWSWRWQCQSECSV